MKILVLGGDGYLGWPTAMHLSAAGHEVVAVDNYLRRNIQRETDCEALFEPPNLHQRAKAWEAKSGKTIHVAIGDLADWAFTDALFRDAKPDAVIHYAEQPSAPYSMLDRHAAAVTFNNNMGVTFNVIQAIIAHVPECHLVKLGTMGEYGTPNIDIEEGWLEVEHKGRKDKFLFPRQAGSLYHTTKVLDTDLLWFYVRVAGLRATDLMQGPVYGIETYENEGSPELYPFFCYDELFGTVVNRFVVQAIAGYPLTVYGKGGQTRGYLDIRDTMQCLRLSLENPTNLGELRIFNQFVETFSVNQLAEQVARVGQARGHQVEIKALPNPRKEMEEHYYNPAHTGLLELGLKPHPLTDEMLDRLMGEVERWKGDIVHDRIFRGVKWKK